MLGGASRSCAARFLRIAIWMAASGVFWIAGGLLEGEARLALWSSRSASSISGHGPGTGRRASASVATTDWDVRGEHIAERCGLFVIICLGETLLISGATFAEAEWTRAGIAAFAVNFLGSVGDVVALLPHRAGTRGRKLIEHSEDPGRVARIAFTYAHIPIVAGIVVSAVAAELMIAHPGGPRRLGRGGLDPRRAGAVPGGQPLVQGADRALAAAVAPCRPRAFRAAAVIVPWISPLGLGALALGDPDAGGGLGVAVAGRRKARGRLMRTWVALLYSIVLTPGRRVVMADLRAVADGLGFASPGPCSRAAT